MAKTALISGASSGIGLELAGIFAQNKVNLVLVARNQAALENLAIGLSKNHGILVHIFAIDLSKPESAETVFDFCRKNNLHIDYLVNNAGFGDYGMFVESDWTKTEQMINLNITTLTHLTRLLLPAMVEAGYGRIMNVASTAAFQPGPTMSVYYATKAYVLHFSEAIDNELRSSGITVTALCPGATESNFQSVADMEDSKLVKGRKLPTAREVAVYGYNAMMKGKTVAIHGTMNYLLANSVRFAPRSLAVKIARWIQRK